MQGNKQHNIEITPTKIKKIICKMVNCKALGPDSLHGYWIKMLVSMQERIVFHLQSWKTIGELPDWMTTGLIVLLLKGKSKGNELSNKRPMIWYPNRRLKNPWRCVHLQIIYHIFCPRVWKAGKSY